MRRSLAQTDSAARQPEFEPKWERPHRFGHGAAAALKDQGHCRHVGVGFAFFGLASVPPPRHQKFARRRCGTGGGSHTRKRVQRLQPTAPRKLHLSFGDAASGMCVGRCGALRLLVVDAVAGCMEKLVNRDRNRIPNRSVCGGYARLGVDQLRTDVRTPVRTTVRICAPMSCASTMPRTCTKASGRWQMCTRTLSSIV